MGARDVCASFGTRAMLAALCAGMVAAVTPAWATTAADGARFYHRDCARCHGPHGRGDGPDGGIFTTPPRDLRGDFLTKYSTAELVLRVRRGSPLRLDVDPKVLADRKHDVAALVAHVKRLPDVDWARAETGRDAYVDRCESCHGLYGHPPTTLPAGSARPRDLADPAFQHDTSDETLRLLVRHGRDGMPPLEPPLSDPDAASVASYVRLLSPGYELYVRYCSNCHGDDGRGAANPGMKGEPKVLDAAYVRAHDDAKLADAVSHMMAEKKPQMPHLRHDVSETAARAIIDFLKGLQH